MQRIFSSVGFFFTFLIPLWFSLCLPCTSTLTPIPDLCTGYVSGSLRCVYMSVHLYVCVCVSGGHTGWARPLRRDGELSNSVKPERNPFLHESGAQLKSISSKERSSEHTENSIILIKLHVKNLLSIFRAIFSYMQVEVCQWPMHYTHTTANPHLWGSVSIGHLEAIRGVKQPHHLLTQLENLFLDANMFWWIFSKLGQEVMPVTLCESFRDFLFKFEHLWATIWFLMHHCRVK